ADAPAVLDRDEVIALLEFARLDAGRARKTQRRIHRRSVKRWLRSWSHRFVQRSRFGVGAQRGPGGEQGRHAGPSTGETAKPQATGSTDGNEAKPRSALAGN